MDNIHVAIRFRPLNKRELVEDQNEWIKIDNNTIYITKSERGETHKFIYDYVFDDKATQKEVFDKVAKNSIDWVVEGYNSTIFAYGPTGTGKSFCMFGHENGEYQHRGIIPRSCDLLFKTVNDKEDVVEAMIKCSFLEIYRENIRDLLVSDKSEINLSSTPRIRQHQNKGVYVQGLIEKFVYSPQEILETIKEGTKQRSIGSTLLNSVSSRSHAVLTLTLTQILVDGTEIISKLNLVDLAGSENVGKSEATGITLLEAQQINKSLSCLGNVIFALTEKGREHVPYRDSKLTYLLQDSLGGNSKTILIATASPHISVYSETINTLRFAKRVKDIKNAPKVNRNESNANLLKTIDMLTKQLADLQSKYEDAKAMIDKIEYAEKVNIAPKSLEAFKIKIDRMEEKIHFYKQERDNEKLRHDQLYTIFDKQRDLAKKASLELYKERIKSHSLSNQLDQYKIFKDSLQSALKTPAVLENIVKNFKLIDANNLGLTMLNVVETKIEIDSPR